MNTRKKMLMWGLALCLVLGLLAGCGQTGSETPGPTATPEPVQDEAEEPAKASGEEAPAQAEQAITVYVTISDAGVLQAAQEPVEVTDGDGDGALTVHDALLAAHDALYQGGAQAGYATDTGDYGLFITKLWGTENGGSYGYCLNNAACMSLTDPVAQGDYLTAYSYADLTAWSDTYAYFDVNTAQASAGEEITLVLSASGYDESWNPVTLPVEGAAVTANGEDTGCVTGADGSVALTFDEAGVYVISASSETAVLVPPVCVVTVG